MSVRIITIGRSGQLATELARHRRPDVTIEAHGRDRIDLSAPSQLEQMLRAAEAEAVINAASYTAVDKAETEPEAAFALNRDGAAALARACAALGVPLVHVSTDYVFDGAKPTPYVETDPKRPTSVYGHSKSEGEDVVLTSGARAAVIRTSWLYAAHGANFVRTMLRLAETRDEIAVVADQLGRPTWAKDLADACVTAALRIRDGDSDALGVFHYAGAGDATWADFATEIFVQARKRGAKSAHVKRISTADYPTPAKRPANSRLDTTKIETALGVRVRDWREACGLCLDELLGPSRAS